MIWPSLPIIQIPPTCDKGISEELRCAFDVFWIDAAACLNHIRQATELILTMLKVPRTTLATRRPGATSARRVDLSLHSRIDKLKSARPKLADLCERLMAVKHLGNAGSHPGEVTREDVFDGFDIMERILDDLYSNNDSNLAKIVREINSRKKPRKKKN